MESLPEIRRQIHRKAAIHDLRDVLRKIGVKTLREEGTQLALSGKTSLDEVLRVTHNDDELLSDFDSPSEKARAA